jgi:hypothetical protein
MSAATLDAPHARASLRSGVRVSDSRVFRAAVRLIVLHIIDDEFLQPGRKLRDPHQDVSFRTSDGLMLSGW